MRERFQNVLFRVETQDQARISPKFPCTVDERPREFP
jgi:hypothetical protein